ncbi:hypothetical protein BH11PAT3_BH11PAT3_2650 [soil metagenome]
MVYAPSIRDKFPKVVPAVPTLVAPLDAETTRARANPIRRVQWIEVSDHELLMTTVFVPELKSFDGV